MGGGGLVVFLVLPLFTGGSPLSRTDDEPYKVDLVPNVETKINLGTADSEFVLSVSPCGVVHWKLYRLPSSFDEEELKAVESDRKIDIEEPSNGELIGGEEGDQRMTFYSAKLGGDDLLLILTSPEEASVSIFHTTSQSSLNEVYPSLPSDPRLFVSLHSDNTSSDQSATVSWTVNPLIQSYPDSTRYRICVVLSLRDPSTSLLCRGEAVSSEEVHCMPQNENQTQLFGLRNGHTYFATVFVRDSRHATVSMYESVEIKVPGGEEEEKRVPPLEEGELRHIQLEGPRGNSLTYEFQATGNTTKRALLAVYSCGGYVRISVWRGKRLLKRTDAFTSFRRFAILNASGKLRIEVINDDQRPNDVRLWIGQGELESPYPSLPDDTSVKVIRRGCDWATIQWLRSMDKRAEYCVYQRREDGNYIEQLVGQPDNSCSPLVHSRSSLVGCYSQKTAVSDDKIGLLETTISGLQSDSTYRLDVVVRPENRLDPQALPYRTVWVRTSSSC